ncbi:MAG: CoA-binding protein [Anaerolineae bacterium]|nr:CoA-binding protein [Anaerolineae bacterium]MCA9888718.1 CoA-binding protein [Anaerolineae bacterium]MCA9892466.1 CoA-binding protein [Anaerolineae bacterium]MCB9460279.1 CoA-binding protein [Anaerolineaceae bacterium]
MSVATMTHKQQVDDFLNQHRIAVSGLSRSKDSGAGAIYLKLRDNGYEVFPLHPEAEALHGDKCYAHLADIPGGVDAVFIMNSPDISEQIVDEAAKLHIKHVWMHNNTFMPSSASEAAVERGRQAGMNVIAKACPMMYLKPDFAHKCMHWMANVMGRLN